MVAVAWLFAGLGMGLATSGTSLATMALSGAADQGRNASSLQFGEAFGGGLFIGVGGTIFAALHPTGDLTATFSCVLARDDRRRPAGGAGVAADGSRRRGSR